MRPKEPALLLTVMGNCAGKMWRMIRQVYYRTARLDSTHGDVVALHSNWLRLLLLLLQRLRLLLLLVLLASVV